MSLVYFVMKILQRFEKETQANVPLSKTRPSILKFLLPTEWDRILIIFVTQKRLLIMVTARHYDIGKRITLFFPGKKKYILLLHKAFVELEKVGISSSIRVNKKKNGKDAIYLRIENDYNEQLIFRMLRTIILHVLQLDEKACLDIVVQTSRVRILEQVPSDPIYPVTNKL